MADKAFYEALPKKRTAAGCLFFNQSGQVMLVKPTYKNGWEIPGGVIEDDESPRQACEREVLEEIGLQVQITKLLVVDYNNYPDEPHKTDALMFIFDGGLLTENELQNIVFNDGEISHYAFFTADNLPEDMNHSLRKRIIVAIQEKTRNSSSYLENQEYI